MSDTQPDAYGKMMAALRELSPHNWGYYAWLIEAVYDAERTRADAAEAQRDRLAAALTALEDALEEIAQIARLKLAQARAALADSGMEPDFSKHSDRCRWTAGTYWDCAPECAALADSGAQAST